MISLKVMMVGALPIDLKSVKGGVEAAILNLFSGFSLVDEIELVHISFIEEINECIQIEHSLNIRILFLPYKVKSKLLDYLVNKSTLLNIVKREQPDIIHIQESEPHLLRFWDWPKSNIVVTQHGIMKEELKYATGIKNRLKFVFKAFVERFVFPSFENVIFISDYNRNLYRGRLKRAMRINNSVNPIFFEPPHQTNNERNSIIYVGVINKRKNLKLVIEALHQLKLSNIRFDLQVVGGYKDKDHDYKNEISDAIRRYDLADQIQFHGWLTQPEILEIYSHCNFFILPSLQETLPVSIAEAMALGKIVIASDVGAISEMFVDQSSGFLFKRNNLGDLVSVLRSINDDREMNFREWSDRIREIARKKYHPLENAKRTLDFYKTVLSSSSKD